MTKRLRWSAGMLAAASIALAGCGGGDNNESATPTAQPPRPSATAASPTAAAASPTAAPEATEPVAPTQAPPTQPPPQPTAPVQPTSPPPPPPPPQQQSLTVVAQNTSFSPRTMSAAAGGPISVTLDNRDASVTHDIVIFAPDGAQVASTPIIVGPAQATTSFTPAAPGTYAFKCSVHPQQMTGTISVR